MSSDIQSLRSATELQISQSVDDANDALDGLQRVSDQIDRLTSSGQVPVALLDERDGIRVGETTEWALVDRIGDRLAVIPGDRAAVGPHPAVGRRGPNRYPAGPRTPDRDES